MGYIVFGSVVAVVLAATEFVLALRRHRAKQRVRTEDHFPEHHPIGI